MSLCPCCGRVYCDHTPVERGQTSEEVGRHLTREELVVWRSEPDGSEKLQNLARKNAHLPVLMGRVMPARV